MKTRKFEKKNYVKELVALMRSTLPEKELAKRIDNYHYNDIAEALTCLTENERKHIYRILGAKHVAEIFTYIDDIEKYFNELTLEKAVKKASMVNYIAIFRYGGIISGRNVWISSGSGNILRTGFNIPYKYF